MALSILQSRDYDDDYNGWDNALYGFSVLFIFACFLSVALLYFRRKRAAQRAAMLPVHQPRGHHRSPTITTAPTYARQDKVFVYDEKMNLIANSHGPPDSTVPEIRITFPDEVDQQSGQKATGRVVVVRITDSGSVGMEPLQHDQLPPYHQAEAGRFQSVELDRIGGLREEAAKPAQPRWS